MSYAPIPDRVQAGVALLDREVPGWDERVDLDALMIADRFRCVLGQVFGSYDVGLSSLDWGEDDDEAYGFDVCYLTEYPRLNDAWRNRIEARRAVAA